jgi:hypothetical protein
MKVFITSCLQESKQNQVSGLATTHTQADRQSNCIGLGDHSKESRLSRLTRGGFLRVSLRSVTLSVLKCRRQVATKTAFTT